MRRSVLSILLIIVISSFTTAQNRDTLIASISPIKWTAPVSLIAAGLIMQPYPVRSSIHSELRKIVAIPNTSIDDYLQHLPLVLLAGNDLVSGISKNELSRQVRHALVSEALTLGTVYLLKTITQVDRPTGGKLSFPSGHTAHAFAGATIFRLALKDTHPQWSWIAYIPPTAVGAYRMIKDKHWSSDVLVGAGIGIAMTQLSYKLDIWHSRSVSSTKTLSQLRMGPSSDGLALIYSF